MGSKRYMTNSYKTQRDGIFYIMCIRNTLLNLPTHLPILIEKAQPNCR